MKSLLNYILESSKTSDESKKTFTFNLKDVDGAKETIESLDGNDCVTVEEETVTITIGSNIDNVEKAKDTIKALIDKELSSQKRTTYESYANKLRKLESKVNSLNDAIESIKNPQSEEE